VANLATRYGLTYSHEYSEIFVACVNDRDATDLLVSGMEYVGIRHELQTLPLSGSEDFGRFGLSGAKSAMVFLGSGPEWPQLHTPEYDFRDELIPIGIRMFSATLELCLMNS